MRHLRRFIVAAGFATIAVLLWRLDPRAVWAEISSVGLLGFALILPFQICDHVFNAIGWRLSFRPEDGRGVPFWKLVRVRIAGDGVNYLTPSGTIAGELVRPALLGDAAPEAVKNYSVGVAKFAQALAQMAFILVGMIFVVLGRLDVLEGRELAMGVCGTLLAMGVIAGALYVLTASAPWAERLWKRSPRVDALRQAMRGYLASHPARFLAATTCFMAGYAWGGAEVILICWLMGIKGVGPFEGLAVEVFSNIVDSIMFFVPAKVGTQEAGKTAIFRILGFTAGNGFAFGLIRHVREVVWASAGFLDYALSLRRAPAPAAPTRAESPPRSRPLARAD